MEETPVSLLKEKLRIEGQIRVTLALGWLLYFLVQVYIRMAAQIAARMVAQTVAQSLWQRFSLLFR